jgi:hypothetical protein
VSPEKQAPSVGSEFNGFELGINSEGLTDGGTLGCDDSVGCWLGIAVGSRVGAPVGISVGETDWDGGRLVEGMLVGAIDCEGARLNVGLPLGKSVDGTVLGNVVGTSVGEWENEGFPDGLTLGRPLVEGF